MTTTRTQRGIAAILCAVLGWSGCATAVGPRVTTAPSSDRQVQDRAVLVEYVQKLPPGSAVRVERANGRSLRGTLMKATDTMIVIQPRTRIPEPAVEIALAEVLSVTPEAGNGGVSVAKAVGAGVAAGAGAALGVFLFILAIFDN